MISRERTRRPVTLEDVLAWLVPAFIIIISFLTWRRAADFTVVRLPVAAFFCAAVFYFFARAQARPAPCLRPVYLCLAAILVTAVFSSFFAFYPPALANGLAWLVLGPGILLMAAHLPVSAWLVPAWAGAGLLLSVFALEEAHRAGEMFYLPLLERAIPRHVTPLGNRNFFAGYLALLVPVTAAFGLAAAGERIASLRGSGGRTEKARALSTGGVMACLCLALTVFFFFMLVKVGSRAALGGAVLGISFLGLLVGWFLLAPRLGNGKGRVLLRGILAALFIGGVIFSSLRAAGVVRQEIRRYIFRGTVDMIMERPWTGFGPGSFLAAFQQFRPPGYYTPGLGATPVSDHSHNEILQVAAETGLPGVLAFLALLGAVYFISFRALGVLAGKRSLPGKGLPPTAQWFLLAGLISGVTALLADGMLSNNLRTNTVGLLFWLALGLCARLSWGALSGRAPESAPEMENPFSRASEVNGEKKEIDTARFLPWAVASVTMLCAALFFFRQANSQARFHEGIMMRQLGAWEEAEFYYRDALRWDPSHIQAAYRLAFVLPRAGKLEEGAALYHDILEASPNFALTHVNLAALYLNVGMVDRARYHLAERLRYNPYDRHALEMMDQIASDTPDTPSRE